MKTLRSTLAVVLLALLLPAFASAEIYVVNSDSDFISEFGCNSGPGEECTLRDAIMLANEGGDEDTIEFVPAIEELGLNSELPTIAEPVTIDGAEGGVPGVELDGSTEGNFFVGFEVTDESTITGLAINDFDRAIMVVGQGNRICNSYLGTTLAGELEENSEIGVWIGGEGADNEIGAGCAKGNLISGNGWFGVLDEGVRTHIAGNLIGTDLSGDLPLPNGEDPPASEPAGGILAEGTDTVVGGVGPGEGNVIAYNQGVAGFGGILGGGVVVKSPSVAIQRNSIFANDARGIMFYFGVTGPVPAIAAVTSSEITDTTVIEGSVEGGPEEDFEIDLFANAICDEYESGFEEFTEAGEGETYLGSATVKTDGSGTGAWKATVPVQAEGTVLTATATAAGMALATSEFSGCAVAPKPTPKPPPPDPPAPPEKPIVKVEPTPENGESVVVAPKAGKVFVTLPGEKKPILLQDGQEIPVGALVDATRGKVTLTSINKAGETQTAVFFGGKFVVAQEEGSGLVVLKLRGGNFKSCGKAKGSTATASARSGRRLWGSGKGKFRTEGNHGSATVRGTVWLTEDRCTGTFFKVKQGVVTVRDFDANETFPLGKGKSYLAQP